MRAPSVESGTEGGLPLGSQTFSDAAGVLDGGAGT
jgi:hypothetical protein